MQWGSDGSYKPLEQQRHSLFPKSGATQGFAKPWRNLPHCRSELPQAVMNIGRASSAICGVCLVESMPIGTTAFFDLRGSPGLWIKELMHEANYNYLLRYRVQATLIEKKKRDETQHTGKDKAWAGPISPGSELRYPRTA
jgi:hypothetical protein